MQRNVILKQSSKQNKKETKTTRAHFLLDVTQELSSKRSVDKYTFSLKVFISVLKVCIG